MPISSVRIVLNSIGIRELLGSEGVRADLMERGERVGAAAREHAPQVGWPDERADLPITVTDVSSAKRARVVVTADHWAGVAVESQYRLLGGSLDAAK
jgi:hypothetical protein